MTIGSSIYSNHSLRRSNMGQLKIVKITTPKARVPHTCHCCGKEIDKGEKYSNYLYKDGKKLVRHYLHLDCHDTPTKDEKGEVIKKQVGPQFHQLPKTEEELRQIVKQDTEDMLETFSFKEHMKIVFIPLVITEMVWHYADKVVQYAAEHRIPQTVKLSRAVKMLKTEYYKEIGKDLPRDNVEHIKEESLKFMQECSSNLFILWLQANQSLKNTDYGLEYLDMRTDAYCALIMLSLLEENEKKVKDIIIEKTGNYVHVANAKIDALKDCMEAYVSPAVIDYSQHVKLLIKIFNNKLDQIDFNVV